MENLTEPTPSIYCRVDCRIAPSNQDQPGIKVYFESTIEGALRHVIGMSQVSRIEAQRREFTKVSFFVARHCDIVDWRYTEDIDIVATIYFVK